MRRLAFLGASQCVITYRRAGRLSAGRARQIVPLDAPIRRRTGGKPARVCRPPLCVFPERLLRPKRRDHVPVTDRTVLMAVCPNGSTIALDHPNLPRQRVIASMTVSHSPNSIPRTQVVAPATLCV